MRGPELPWFAVLRGTLVTVGFVLGGVVLLQVAGALGAGGSPFRGVIGSLATLLTLFGIVAGGWYSARRSNGGVVAGALAGVLPGALAGGFIVYLALTADVEPALAEAFDDDLDEQLVPPSLLFAGFGVFVFAYVVGVAALGGFLSAYVPLSLVGRRIRRRLAGRRRDDGDSGGL